MLTLKDLATTVALTAVMLVASLAASPVAATESSAERVCRHGLPQGRADTGLMRSLIAIVPQHDQ